MFGKSTLDALRIVVFFTLFYTSFLEVPQHYLGISHWFDILSQL